VWRDEPSTPRERVGSLLSTSRYDAVLEPDRFRFLERSAALEFWSAWWKDRGK
jgi:hypothetical protein